MPTRLALTTALLATCLAPSCTAPTLRADFESIDPSERVRAIALTAQQLEDQNLTNQPQSSDHATAAQLIEELASSDPAVRMIAIDTLRRLTGQSFAYDWAAPPNERRQAIDRWIEWHTTSNP